MLFFVKGNDVDPGPSPPNYMKSQLTFLPPVIFDAVPSGKSFGSVNEDAKASYCVVCTYCVQ